MVNVHYCCTTLYTSTSILGHREHVEFVLSSIQHHDGSEMKIITFIILTTISCTDSVGNDSSYYDKCIFEKICGQNALWRQWRGHFDAIFIIGGAFFVLCIECLLS